MIALSATKEIYLQKIENSPIHGLGPMLLKVFDFRWGHWPGHGRKQGVQQQK